jgi:hypothetical protein
MILSWWRVISMDFFIKYLEDTLEAIKKLNSGPITVKKIRTIKGIRSSDRSQINFIWRSLAYLEKKGVLTANGSRNPKSYTIANGFDIEAITSQAKKERT